MPAALARLQTRYKIVVLSNGDPDMLESAKQYHGIPFDRVISVAEANAFKPHVATYTKAAELLGVKLDEVLFVANHAFDCIGAKSAGMRTAFIDRRRRPVRHDAAPAGHPGPHHDGAGGADGLTRRRKCCRARAYDCPPLQLTTCPVMKLASSEARNAMAAACSSGRPRRRKAC